VKNGQGAERRDTHKGMDAHFRVGSVILSVCLKVRARLKRCLARDPPDHDMDHRHRDPRFTGVSHALTLGTAPPWPPTKRR
jgi:hypothetical protein